jgi:hypothetical protein
MLTLYRSFVRYFFWYHRIGCFFLVGSYCLKNYIFIKNFLNIVSFDVFKLVLSHKDGIDFKSAWHRRKTVTGPQLVTVKKIRADFEPKLSIFQNCKDNLLRVYKSLKHGPVIWEPIINGSFHGRFLLSFRRYQS